LGEGKLALLLEESPNPESKMSAYERWFVIQIVVDQRHGLITKRCANLLHDEREVGIIGARSEPPAMRLCDYAYRYFVSRLDDKQQAEFEKMGSSVSLAARSKRVRAAMAFWHKHKAELLKQKGKSE
jgi:hypothetical protein